MLAERMLTAKLGHPLACEGEEGKKYRRGSSPKKMLTPDGEPYLCSEQLVFFITVAWRTS
jgi:hypothetical protein